MKSIGEYKTELLDALDSKDFDSFFNLYQNDSDDYRNNNGFDELSRSA